MITCQRLKISFYVLFTVVCIASAGGCAAKIYWLNFMANLIDNNHDSGGTPATHWGNVSDSGPALTITVAAGLDGSARGLENDITQPAWSVFESALTPAGTNEIKTGFNIDTSPLTFPGTNSSTGDFIYGHDMGGGGDVLFNLQIHWNSSNQLLVDFSKLWVSDGDVVTIFMLNNEIIGASGEYCFEVRIVRESSDGATDGEVELLVNGSSIFSNTVFENFNAFANYATYVHRGNSNTGAFSGVGYSDEFLLDDDSNATLNCVAAAAESGTYMIGQAIDTEEDGETLYATVWRNSTLFLQRWSVSGSPLKLAEVSLGAATFADMQSKTETAFPFAGSDSDVWVFGRMTAPVGAPTAGTRHILSSTVGGTGTWSDVSGITGSWANADVMDSLHVTPPVDGAGLREFAAVRRRSTSPPELWIGNNALALSVAIPFPSGTGVEYKGMHKAGAGGEISIGSAAGGTGSAANRVFSTVTPYTRLRDISFDFPSGTVEVLRYF